MRDATLVLDQQFPEMRWRCLSLAADLDRLQRSENGPKTLAADPRLQTLREAIAVLLDTTPNRADRAQRVLMLFSDQSPPPPR